MEGQKETAVVATANKEGREIVYSVAGQDVRLSKKIVKDYLTKGDGNVSDQDIVQFIGICQFNQLNPFLNEAYLVKYGTSPAQMIVSKEALMKRADACPNYDGIQAGIIIERGEEIIEVEGCFYKSTDKLLGGWAKVYRKDRTHPIVSKVNLEEYDKKMSIWKDKKATMISKIAKVQALREAFPAQLGAMYTAEEQDKVQDVEYEEVKDEVKAEIGDKANGEEIKVTPIEPIGSQQVPEWAQ